MTSTEDLDPATRPEVDFDHLSPGFAVDPAGAFRSLRESCPIAWSPHHGGFWVLTRYEDLAAAARDDATFSSARPEGSPLNVITIPMLEMARNVPLEMDPPEFFGYRRALNPILSPAAVERTVVPLLEAVTRWCVDRFVERGSADLVTDLTAPVPAIFTMGWLGLPVDRWQAFVAAKRVIVLPVEERAGPLAELHAIQEVWRAIVEQRLAEPRDDIISYLGAQEIDGRPLTAPEVADMVSLLVHGGFGTSNHLMGQTLMHLSRHPELRQRLRDEPELIGSACEEYLRLFPPNTHLARTVTRDTELNGCPMRAGDRVMLPWLAANRDPDVFDEPDQFVVDRFPNRHTAFGLGIHRCVGSNVARHLFRIVLTEVLERLPDFHVDEAAAVEMPTQGISTGWASLPATFTPGAVVGEPAPFPELEDPPA
jgi:cytochrome P450